MTEIQFLRGLTLLLTCAVLGIVAVFMYGTSESHSPKVIDGPTCIVRVVKS